MRRFLPLLLLLFTGAVSPTVEFDVQIGTPTGIVYNVANAPAWAPNASYTHVGHFGDRVLSGAALTPGPTPSYTDEQPLYLLELTQAGTSGASQPNIASCPSTVSDGTAAWKCLTKVDYITLTSAMVDDPTAWQPNTGYYHHQYVRKNKIAWWPQNDNHYETFAPAPHQCVSGTAGPDINITASNSEHPDGDPLKGCYWLNAGTIPYSSSHANAWPHQLYVNNSNPVIAASSLLPHRFLLWDGGAQRPNSYEAGKNGEDAPIPISNHISTDGVMCPDGTTGWWGGQNCSPKQQFPLAIEAAPGEGICESPGPLAYDRTRGVALFADGSGVLGVNDFIIDLRCVQVKNVNTDAQAISGGNNVLISGNFFVDRSIIDSSGFTDLAPVGGGIILNSFVVNRSNAPAPAAVATKYSVAIIGSTVVMLGNGADRVGLLQECNNGFSQESIIIDSIIVGAKHSIGQNGIVGDPANWCSPLAWKGAFTSNNVTDLPASTAVVTYPVDSVTGNHPMTAAPLLGKNNLYGQSAASLFVDPANDFRLKAGSPAKGAGIAGNASFDSRPTSNTVDFFGAPRAPSYSAGAAQ